MVDILFSPGKPTATKLASSFATELELSDLGSRSRREANDVFSNATTTTEAPRFVWLVNASVANSETIVDGGDGAAAAAAVAASTSGSSTENSENEEGGAVRGGMLSEKRSFAVQSNGAVHLADPLVDSSHHLSILR